MNLSVRSFLKRKMPSSVKGLIQRARLAAEPPPIDDIVLSRYRLMPDGSPTMRLNLVIPNLSAQAAFGGVMTGLDVVMRLLAELRLGGPCDVRVIFTEPDRDTDHGLLIKAAQPHGVDISSAEFLSISGSEHGVGVRRDDLFVTYNWWTTLNTQYLIDQQGTHFGTAVRPITYLIQEYEPQIFPFSSAHMLAREAYDVPPRLWGIFNSSNLANYFARQGHSADKSFVFEPVINESLRPYLDDVGKAERAHRILVYGRPNVRRNCFPALVRGLREWASNYPQFANWEVISAGMPHKPVALGDGRSLESVGKLSLDDYAETLLTSSVGVSLMASPHPSYPPLEMAHMGLRTVTNGYLCKDPQALHPNIVPTPSLRAGALAQAIATACELSAGRRDLSRDPQFMRDEAYPFIPELAQCLRASLD